MAKVAKMVYRFDEGDARMRDLLGGKGANLCEMAGLGLPVPPGFIITTEVCREYYARDQKLPDGLWGEVEAYMGHVESSTGRQFGSPDAPLLVSVRSGAPISMPGMMDTLLNLGINDQVALGLGGLMGDLRPAYDAYRRFLDLYGRIVLSIDSSIFDDIMDHHKEQAGAKLDQELSASQLWEVGTAFRAAIRQAGQSAVPEDPWEQLRQAIEAVFRSWNGARAITYRNARSISHDMGTAVSVMAMVFGNLGDNSGTGVLFSRNPSTGQNELYGEYLANAQGEDVVAGIRTPRPISSLAQIMPAIHDQLTEMADQLEAHYRDVQDIEFTIEGGRLYMLQTRNAARAPQAAVKVAVDMANEGMITREEALLRIDPEELTHLFMPQFHPEDTERALSAGALFARGFGASPGACTGKAFLDSKRAVAAAREGATVVLVRPETNPEDIGGILAAAGVVTSRGGVTSHAAVVTRGLGKACVVGCEEMRVDMVARQFVANGRIVQEGDQISVDGATGEIFTGEISTFQPSLEGQGELQVLLSWADDVRRLGVLANVDTPDDAARARAMGAEGIGLCRTEHMFLGDRVPLVRQALLSAPEAESWLQEHPQESGTPEPPAAVVEYRQALAQLHQHQTEDFMGILRAMAGLPVIIRLLDAPLHEFAPHVEELREANPMLGHRGCRVGITFPTIYEMQVDAIITASARLTLEGVQAQPEIMIPLTAHINELAWLRARLSAVMERVQRETNTSVHCPFGTMIEVPRAALTAAEIAREADFFSFGTNDLTQTTYGFSRDDAEGKFLKHYLDKGILPSNPFVTLDPGGVGELVRIGAEQGRSTRPDLELGICGEHGGDPQSVAFCHTIGLDYVSCSPFRVPIARLAAAQAALKAKDD